MPYVTAKLLDIANARIVSARVGARQKQLVATLAGQRRDEPAVPGPLAGGIPGFQPVRVGSRGQARDAASEAGEPRESARATRWTDGTSGWTAVCLQPSRATAPRHRPAVILLHGWLATRLHLRVYRRLARPLVRAGIEVWMPRLPLHAERTPAEAISGERFLSADLRATSAAIRQSVAETLACRAWLRGRGRDALGLWGISLGGWVAGLSAARAPWDALCLWEPVVDPLETLGRSPLAADIREWIDADDSAASLADLDTLIPAAHSLQVSPEDAVLLLGRHDNVVYPRGAIRAARNWGIGIHWLPHGHISLIASPRALRTSADFLAGKIAVARS